MSVSRVPVGKQWRFMEVCGTHTMSIAGMGIRSLLGDRLRLVSGPGCPICVTSEGDLMRAVSLAGRDNVIITTFGDMMRVPAQGKSLLDARALGADVRVVYSPFNSLAIADENPGSEVVFLAVGFETTIPAIAATVEKANELGIKNFSILPMMKLVPPALRLLCEHPELAIDGFILPGHVSTIIGPEIYSFIVDEFGIPGVITGFSPEDIADCLLVLTGMIKKGAPKLVNSYYRAVHEGGNPTANALMERAFEPVTAYWRGIGDFPESGLALRSHLRSFDAQNRFELESGEPPELEGCRCGEIILGKIIPPECPMFEKRCNPENPLGPCMVSSEGACAAYYKYR